MKYLKRYNEDIEWEFDDEEINFDDTPLNIGDQIIMDGKFNFWDSYHKRFNFVNFKDSKNKVIKIDKSENIDSDENYNFKKGTIPYDGWLFMIKGHWPWFKYNSDNIKKL